ncbi:Protein RALF-like 31 [Capsicum chinense]|nr:Protein RALF-like 31 [Capsicum chinense]
MIFCNGVSVFDLNSVKDCNFDVMGKRGCVEKVDQEDMMDSESNRRVLLMQKKYISYETLKRDLVPCNTPGASYYNCRAPGEANTYNRGCEIITRCARQVDEDDLMDSESNRRVLLMQKKYISYGTLKRDLVPFNTSGASYYNCKAPGAANTYNRGCEIITRCATQIDVLFRFNPPPREAWHTGSEVPCRREAGWAWPDPLASPQGRHGTLARRCHVVEGWVGLGVQVQIETRI